MSELIKSISIVNFLNQVGAIQERLISAHKNIKEAEEIYNASNMGKSKSGNLSLSYILTNKDLFSDRFVLKNMKDIQAKAWNHLMSESGLKSFMSAEKRNEWKTVIEKQAFPDLTQENIAATFRNIHSDRESMFQSGVIECFKHLSWDYKTNNPCKFGKRIIFHKIKFYCDNIDDLMRIFSLLDGKPEPDHRYGIDYQMGEAGSEKLISNSYISLRWFKKGSGHITFKRPDLVKAMNEILSKHYPNALPSRI